MFKVLIFDTLLNFEVPVILRISAQNLCCSIFETILFNLATIPAPLVEAKRMNTSILIKVNSPGDDLDIVGYKLKYKYLAERASSEKKVTINGSDSMYELLEASELPIVK